TPSNGIDDLTFRQIAVLGVFGVAFATMIWGVSSQGWWMTEMSALFIAASVIAGFIGWLGERMPVEAFIEGAKDVLGVALVIGLARGIVAIMDAGQITDTFLHFGETALEDASAFVFINTMFGIEMAMSFLVPSSSGLAVLSMPVLGPLSDFAEVERHLTVTAFQAASGLIGIISPSAAIVVGALTMGRIGYDKWLRFVLPLMAALILLVCLMLSVAVVLA
ncbi:MAG: YfcC family protein, partial [Pseudomonadota bacterium]